MLCERNQCILTLSSPLHLLIEVGCFILLPVDHCGWLAANGEIRALLVVERYPLSVVKADNARSSINHLDVVRSLPPIKTGKQKFGLEQTFNGIFTGLRRATCHESIVMW